MKKTITFLSLFMALLYLPLHLSAQVSHHYHEVIYLKNGTVVKGIILEHLSDKAIRVKTRDQGEVVYKEEEVDHIVKEVYDIRRKGFFNLTEASIGIGKTDASIGVSTINGFIVKPHLYLGIGAAYDYYQTAGSLIPVFADVRITFHDRRLTPFVYGDFGYSFSASPQNNVKLQGGLFINPGVGIKSYITKKTALLVSVGVRVQGLSYEIPKSILDRENLYYSMFVLRAGLRF